MRDRIVAILAALTLAGCGSPSPETGTAHAPDPASTKTVPAQQSSAKTGGNAASAPATPGKESPVPDVVDIVVMSPRDHATFFADEAIEFRAAAQRDDESPLDATVSWSSSIDGPLDVTNGLGYLSAGAHSLEARVKTPGHTGREEVIIAVLRRVEVVEALILGTGPLAVPPGVGRPNCLRQGQWSGWTRGSHITLELPAAMSARKVDLATRFAEAVTQASHFDLSVRVEVHEETLPRFTAGVVTFIQQDVADCPHRIACFTPAWHDDGSLASGIVHIGKAVDDTTVAHELGHALMGLCHISGAALAGDNSLMTSPPRLYSTVRPELPSRLDLLAFQTMLASGLEPGADRASLVSQGIVAP